MAGTACPLVDVSTMGNHSDLVASGFRIHVFRATVSAGCMCGQSYNYLDHRGSPFASRTLFNFVCSKLSLHPR